MGWRKVLWALFAVGVFVTGTGYADLPPLAQPDNRGPVEQGSPSSSDEFESALTANLTASYWLSGQPLPPLALAGQAVEEAHSPWILADRQTGLRLCLYALFGMGLLKSVPCVRKLPRDMIPAWYYEGGPSEIGSLLAVSADCLRPALVCFLQPENKTEHLPPFYRLGIAAALWRESQFVPTLRAARAPPQRSWG